MYRTCFNIMIGIIAIANLAVHIHLDYSFVEIFCSYSGVVITLIVWALINLFWPFFRWINIVFLTDENKNKTKKLNR